MCHKMFHLPGNRPFPRQVGMRDDPPDRGGDGSAGWNIAWQRARAYWAFPFCPGSLAPRRRRIAYTPAPVPLRQTYVAGVANPCRPGTVFGVLLHIAFQVCCTMRHLQHALSGRKMAFFMAKPYLRSISGRITIFPAQFVCCRRLRRFGCLPLRSIPPTSSLPASPGNLFSWAHPVYEATGGHGHRSSQPPPLPEHKNRKKIIRIVKTCIRANSFNRIFVYFCSSV